VLLTLSVSGAPFLGLFGTVVGIMITFATIAATGDVNVNTIAPGVAAALTTTVAGLMVAISVMFAYNHLTLRISNLTSAMEVFADELVGRLALAHTLKGREHASPQPG
jgi:biopolymer transport protein ExbB